MKNKSMKILAVILAGGLGLGSVSAQTDAGAAAPAEAKPPQKLPFYVYSDQGDHFIPSGYMGDTSDITIVGMYKQTPAKGAACMKVKYSGKSGQGNKWAGVYWQDPANNWGTVKGAGYNLTGAKKLKFMAKGDKGGEVIEFKSGGISGEFPDSYRAEAPIITLTPEWQEYAIDLEGQDLSTVIGGFIFAVAKDKNPDGATFFLDEIRFQAD
jgi:hypothetical protein